MYIIKFIWACFVFFIHAKPSLSFKIDYLFTIACYFLFCFSLKLINTVTCINVTNTLPDMHLFNLHDLSSVTMATFTMVLMHEYFSLL